MNIPDFNKVLIIYLGGSVLLSILLTRFLVAFPILAQPNPRSSHKAATPTAGGIIIYLFSILTCFIQDFILETPQLEPQWKLLAIAFFIAVIGFLDDLYELKPSIRLMLSALCSWSVFLFVLTPVPAASPWFYILILLNLGFMNAFNFFDGLNGLAGTFTLITIFFMGLTFPENALYLWVLIPGLVGFLFWNCQGKIFMGDTGALFLGFILPLLVLIDRNEHPLVLILFLGHFYFPMLSDISLTILFRIFQGKDILNPHRGFYFLKLSDQGYSHGVVTLIYGLFATIQGGLGLFFNLHDPHALMVVYGINFVFYGVVIRVIHRMTK